MAARVYKTGTIVTRTKNLIDAGVLKARPLWLDVIEALPPSRLTTHNNPPEPGKPPGIVFPSDKDIKKFHQDFIVKRTTKPTSLFETHKKVTPPPSKMFIAEMQKQQLLNDEVKEEEEEEKRQPANTSTSTVVEAATKVLKRNKAIKINVRIKDRDEDTPAEKLLKFLNEVDNFEHTKAGK